MSAHHEFLLQGRSRRGPQFLKDVPFGPPRVPVWTRTTPIRTVGARTVEQWPQRVAPSMNVF